MQNQRLYLCQVRVAKDSHHSKVPFAYPIGDEDSHWDDLFACHSLVRVGDEVNSSLAPQFQGDQSHEELLQHTWKQRVFR